MKRSCRDPYYIQLVFEYLLHLGLLDTAAILQKECEVQKYYVPPSDNDTESQLKFMLLRYFDLREDNYFFEALHSASIIDDDLCSMDIKKLLADLHVYFVASSFVKTQDLSESASAVSSYCEPSASSNKLFVQSSMLRLSNFLERNCTNLRDDPEYKPYFSLSVTLNILHHPLFLQSLQDSWVSNLRRRLQEYLWLKYSATKVPDIVLYLPPYFSKESHGQVVNCQISCCHPVSQHPPDNFGDMRKVEKKSEVMMTDHEVPFKMTKNESIASSDSSHNEPENKANSSQAPHSHHATLFIRRQNQKISLPLSGDTMMSDGSVSSSKKHEECQRRYIQLKKKFSQLHSDYHNLIGVASELTVALENTARGQQIDLRETLSNCLHIFPELFSYHQQPISHENKGIKGRFSLRTTDCDWKLDMVKIKKHLQERDVKTRLLLLQALRWAVTKNSGEKRECIMNQFVDSDLLNLKSDTLLRYLLTPTGVTTPHPLQQSAARLLNTLASVQSGRSYLAQNSETVSVTASVLQQQAGISSDLITKSMLVAALQKLSLRRNQRIAMIQLGMVEWLFQQFLNVNVVSSYSLEYGTALLMNLCLHQTAKENCVPIAQNVISVLINLLATPVTQALPYINGILYSLITQSALNEAAAKLGLARTLEGNILKQDNIEIKKQMEHILLFHKSLLDSKDDFTPPLPASEGEMMDDDDEELDLLGEDLDEQDPVRNIREELSGEDLLKAHYLLPYQSHGSSGEITLSESDGLSHATVHQSTQDSGSVVESSRQKAGNKLEGKLQDQSVKSNWHRRRVQVIRSGSLRKDGETTKAVVLSEDEEFTSDPAHSLPNASRQSNGIVFHTSEPSFVVCEERNQRTLPQIAIHLAPKSDDTGTDESKEHDDDFDDVQVGGTLTKNTCDVQCAQTCPQSGSNPGSPKVDKEHRNSPGNKNNETCAFMSRPKIPRTPPH